MDQKQLRRVRSALATVKSIVEGTYGDDDGDAEFSAADVVEQLLGVELAIDEALDIIDKVTADSVEVLVLSRAESHILRGVLNSWKHNAEIDLQDKRIRPIISQKLRSDIETVSQLQQKLG